MIADLRTAADSETAGDPGANPRDGHMADEDRPGDAGAPVTSQDRSHTDGGAEQPPADPPAGDLADGSGNNGAGRIVDLKIETELQDSYLTYAMSTIMDRALPDVRDGLKPSQRRILVAMNDLNLRPGKKHIKCAKITGDTSGNYHPHGNQVIYPTLAGLAQKWKMRVPLVDPQGNFGSIEGDPPAAERYTEARMHVAAMDLLADLKLDTVDFQPNYDDRMLEPTVLPGKFPNLLINGGMGIAVGMATSLPPHNPAEILDAIVRVVDNPDIPLLELLTDETDEEGNIVRLGVKGPDFPTGGTILGRKGILDAYESGRGRVAVRGECHVEDTGKAGKQQLVIDSIPYSLMQNTLVEKIVEAVKDDRITEVSDVRNESGRDAQTRVVVELKKGADPAVIENQLCQHTPLQQNFSIINIALVNRQPRTLGLKELIRCYIDHRIEVIRRRTTHLLREAKKRAHVLEGMIYAVCDIDEVIKLIRSSRTREEAIEKLMDAALPHRPRTTRRTRQLPGRLTDRLAKAEAVGGVVLTRVQAETIGSMRLIQLVGPRDRAAREGVQRELTDEEIEDYESILATPARVFTMIKEDCDEMKARHGAGYGTGGPGARRTRIEEAAGDIDIASLIREEDMVVTFSRGGLRQARAGLHLPVSGPGRQGHPRGGREVGRGRRDRPVRREHARRSAVLHRHGPRVQAQGLRAAGDEPDEPRAGDPELHPAQAGREDLRLPGGQELRGGRGLPVLRLQGGIVKRTLLRDYRNVNKSGLIAVGLKEGDELFNVIMTGGRDDVIVVSSTGMAIRFNEQDARPMGRKRGGREGHRPARDRAIVIGAMRVPMTPDADDDLMTADTAAESGLALLTITDNGYGKRTAVDEYRVQPEDGKMRSQSRGGKGRTDIKLGAKNGTPVAAMGVQDTDDVVVVTEKGQLVRVSAESISRYGRGTQGVRVVTVNAGDAVVTAARVVESDTDEAGADADEADAGETGGPEAPPAGRRARRVS